MELISKELVDLEQSCDSQKAVFEQIAKIAFQNRRITDEEQIVSGLFQREAQTSTGMIDGFAIPHTQNEAVIEPSLVIIRNDREIEWETLDNSKVNFILAILIPDKSENNLHLKVLSTLSKKLMNETFRNQLFTAQTSTEIISLLEGI